MSTNTFTVGRLSKDLEYNTGANGNKYARGSIATSHPFDRKKTIFYNIVFFGKTAELLHQLVGQGGKGREIVITEGFLEPGTYPKQVNGTEVTMYSVTYVVQKFELVGGSGQQQQQQQNNGFGQQQQNQQNNNSGGWGDSSQTSQSSQPNNGWGGQQNKSQDSSQPNTNGWGSQVDIGDDDLPF